MQTNQPVHPIGNYDQFFSTLQNQPISSPSSLFIPPNVAPSSSSSLAGALGSPATSRAPIRDNNAHQVLPTKSMPSQAGPIKQIESVYTSSDATTAASISIPIFSSDVSRAPKAQSNPEPKPSSIQTKLASNDRPDRKPRAIDLDLVRAVQKVQTSQAIHESSVQQANTGLTQSAQIIKQLYDQNIASQTGQAIIRPVTHHSTVQSTQAIKPSTAQQIATLAAPANKQPAVQQNTARISQPSIKQSTTPTSQPLESFKHPLVQRYYPSQIQQAPSNSVSISGVPSQNTEGSTVYAPPNALPNIKNSNDASSSSAADQANFLKGKHIIGALSDPATSDNVRISHLLQLTPTVTY